MFVHVYKIFFYALNCKKNGGKLVYEYSNYFCELSGEIVANREPILRKKNKNCQIYFVVMNIFF